MPTLTRDEARERAALLTVASYELDLDLTGADRQETKTFRSATRIRFTCAEPGASTFLEVKPSTLHEVVINGRRLDPTTLDDNRLRLENLQAENEITVVGDFAYSNTGEGMHRFVDPADGRTYLYAMTFLDEAQRIFGCFDQPDLKAPFTIRVTAPPEWTVVGNERGHQIVPRRWEFTTSQPLATYFATLVAGPYYSTYAEHDGIQIGLHCRQALATYMDREADELFTVTKQSFDYYHRIFGVRYPFGDTYDQAFVPEFNAGAMENPGCVTFRDQMIFRSAVSEFEREQRCITVAHEMAHMWFGDLVTMRWWDDLWLNETFADYLGVRTTVEATRFTTANTTFTLYDKGSAYWADQLPSTHPISADVPDAANALTNFDGISYEKGQAAMRQLGTWLGDERFLAGLRDHFANHAYGNAELTDLLDSFAHASGKDVHIWAQVWLREAQVNTLRPLVEVDADEHYTDVAIEQTAPESHPVLRPHQIGVGLYSQDAASGRVSRTERLDVELDPAIDNGRTPVAALTGRRQPDLLLLNDGDLTYAKVRFDERSRAALPELLPQIDDGHTRALLWFTAYDMTRDAELPASSFVELVASGVGNETEDPVSQTLLYYAQSLADRYVAPDRRDDVLAVLATRCRELLAGAEPGTGAQLVYGKAFVGAAAESDAPTLRDWLEGDNVPSGLEMDADLRWRTLLRLSVLGAAGADDIDAEARRDATSEGQRHAARCRSALPTAEAKADAWHRMMADESLSNYLLVATAEGFWQPEVRQRELTQPYVERYFVELPDWANRRTAWIVQSTARRAYPWHPVSAATIELADRMLARDDITPSLRRVVVDQTDEARRVLAARAYDSEYRA